MDLFFNPHSVAVVGVSESPANLGRQIVANLQEFDFDGIVYLVGPKGGTAFGRRIHKSVADIPDQVDLAVLLIPARHVPGVLEECGGKGIRRAVIETAGFSEMGEEGREIEEQVVEVARKHGIRFVGPNCIGVISLQNGLSLPFAGIKDVFARGGISIISQSGGVGLDYLNVLASENLGLSKFASIGNKLDVDECDLLEYLVEDDRTDIICMYLESISDGRRLMRIARHTEKPILVHKSNVGAMAADIAQSHTASLSGDDAVVTAALDQVGIARFDNADTLVNYLKVLPLPPLRGNRLAILSRSGGHAVIAADACERAGFALTVFPEPFLRSIEKHFRAQVIRLTNPLDLGDLFDYEVYSRIVDETLRLDDVDGVVFLHTYMSAVERDASRAFLHKLEEHSFSHGKPVATCVSTDGEEMSALRRTLPHPVFTSPEAPIEALALLRDREHGRRPEPRLPDGPVDATFVREVMGRCRAAGKPVLLDEGLGILEAAGLRVARGRLVSSADEAIEAAGATGGPVAMKLVAAEASHKSDIGGVLLGIEGPDGVRAAYAGMQKAAGRAGVREPVVLVQPMVPDGMEIILGARRDPTFGPVVLAGLGGVYVEIFCDVAMRVVPFGEDECDAMLRRLRAYPLLEGVRGRTRRDLAALRQAILAVARLVAAFPEISELDVNPLMVLPEGRGAVAVDARLVVGDPPA